MHTPAPWKANSNVNTTDPDKSGYYVTDEQGYIVSDVHSYGNTKPAEANARLIASAPELLEALEVIRAIQNGEWDNPLLVKYGSIPVPAQDLIAEIAEQAIRKAKGE